MDFRIFFAPDDGQGEGGVATDSGSEGASPFDSAAMDAVSNGGGGGEPDGTPLNGPAQTAPQPFFELEDEKGKKRQFHSQDELRDFLKKGTMMRSDYTRKTQSLSEERKQFDQERNRMMNEIMEQRERYNKYNKFLKENPHVFNEIKKRMQNGTTGDVAVEKARAYVDETKSELQKELEDLKSWRKQREFQEQRDRIYERMKQRYPDFSRDSVQSLMEEVDPQNPESLIELMYHAHRGKRMTPDQQARMAQSQQRKQQGRMMPGGGAPAQSQSQASSLDEAYNQAMRDIQSSG